MPSEMTHASTRDSRARAAAEPGPALGRHRGRRGPRRRPRARAGLTRAPPAARRYHGARSIRGADMSTFITRLDEGGDGPRVAVKDIIDVAGTPTTAGSRAVERRATPAARDAACLSGCRAAGRGSWARRTSTSSRCCPTGSTAGSAPRATRWTRTSSPAGRRAARRWRSPTGTPTSRWAATPAARSGCPRRAAGSSGSRRRSAGSASTASGRSRPASTRSAPWAGTWRPPRSG